MASAYVASATATFKTARLQREILIKGSLATAVKVGDVVTLSSAAIAPVTSSTASYSTEASISAVNAAVKAGVVAGTYIVAQSDMTVEYGHVPVENRDYKYDDKVASSSTEKYVAVYKVVDVDDLIVGIRSKVEG